MDDGDQSLIGTLYLKFAKQKCSIEVDEEKVEAAAVTAIGGRKGGDGCTIREAFVNVRFYVQKTLIKY